MAMVMLFLVSLYDANGAPEILNPPLPGASGPPCDPWFASYSLFCTLGTPWLLPAFSSRGCCPPPPSPPPVFVHSLTPLPGLSLVMYPFAAPLQAAIQHAVSLFRVISGVYLTLSLSVITSSNALASHPRVYTSQLCHYVREHVPSRRGFRPLSRASIRWPTDHQNLCFSSLSPFVHAGSIPFWIQLAGQAWPFVPAGFCFLVCWSPVAPRLSFLCLRPSLFAVSLRCPLLIKGGLLLYVSGGVRLLYLHSRSLFPFLARRAAARSPTLPHCRPAGWGGWSPPLPPPPPARTTTECLRLLMGCHASWHSPRSASFTRWHTRALLTPPVTHRFSFLPPRCPPGFGVHHLRPLTFPIGPPFPTVRVFPLAPLSLPSYFFLFFFPSCFPSPRSGALLLPPPRGCGAPCFPPPGSLHALALSLYRP
ncbi:unnamed protein product [Prunus armeniaca]|uniref:Uncharacterized protein n=1 Tax=Prunus armeniaca TaxID=36596 RepID=A0A6J5XAU4_PRUAR|nr:unnamed protein product [Prunus armeniaca]